MKLNPALSHPVLRVIREGYVKWYAILDILLAWLSN